MNKWCGSGRVTKDVNVKYSDDLCIARFTMACNRRGKDKGADFISCIAFGKTGEFCEKYVRKGVKFDISGHIQTGSYTNKDNQTIYTTDVIVEEIEFGESKSASQNNAPQTVEVTSDGFDNVSDGFADDGFEDADDPDGLPFN